MTDCWKKRRAARSNWKQNVTSLESWNRSRESAIVEHFGVRDGLVKILGRKFVNPTNRESGLDECFMFYVQLLEISQMTSVSQLARLNVADDVVTRCRRFLPNERINNVLSLLIISRYAIEPVIAKKGTHESATIRTVRAFLSRNVRKRMTIKDNK